MDPQAEFGSLAKGPRRPTAKSFRATIGALVALMVVLIAAMIIFGLVFGGLR